MRRHRAAARRGALAWLAVVVALTGCSAARPLAQRVPPVERTSPTSTSTPPTTGAPTHHRHHHHRHHPKTSAPATSPASSPVAPPTSQPPTTIAPPTSPTAPSTSASHPRRHGHPATVVLNPGHNGDDAQHPEEIDRLVPSGFGQEKSCETTGTDTDAGYPEHAFNWDVALRVRVILQQHGLNVVLTRPNDVGVGPCVNQRAAIGDHPWDVAVVSIHADGAPASGQGFHVNQCSRIPDGATRQVARESRALGRAIHATLESSSGLVPSTYIGSDGYYYRDDLAGLNLATRPATFLELGNMRNSHDAALQSSAAGRQRIAAVVAAGILAYLGVG